MTQKSMRQGIPQHDYRPALEGALSWLGNRYLLAEPLNRRPDDRKMEVVGPGNLSVMPRGATQTVGRPVSPSTPEKYSL